MLQDELEAANQLFNILDRDLLCHQVGMSGALKALCGNASHTFSQLQGQLAALDAAAGDLAARLALEVEHSAALQVQVTPCSSGTAWSRRLTARRFGNSHPYTCALFALLLPCSSSPNFCYLSSVHLCRSSWSKPAPTRPPLPRCPRSATACRHRWAS